MELLESLERKHPRTRVRGNSLRLISMWVATGFGLGYLPPAPGTYASILATVAWYFVYQFLPPASFPLHLVTVILLVPITWWTAGRTARTLERDDPSCIIMDEVLGQSLALLFAPLTLVNVIVAFAAFRFFDIVKPFPVRPCERLPGGLGILMDDMTAGIYAGILLLLINAS